VSIITIASALAQTVGLGKKIGGLFAAKNGVEVAEQVIDMAKLITGAPTEVDALEALQTDPEARLRFEEALIDRQVKLERIAHEDRVDARSMQVAVMESERSGWLAKNFIYLLTFVLVSFAIGYSVAVTFFPLTPEGERYADLILNVVIVGGLIGGLMKFFYGGGGGPPPAQLGGKNLRDLSDYGR